MDFQVISQSLRLFLHRVRQKKILSYYHKAESEQRNFDTNQIKVSLRDIEGF